MDFKKGYLDYKVPCAPFSEGVFILKFRILKGYKELNSDSKNLAKNSKIIYNIELKVLR